jgi:predicted ArsR family transcriptional regulator
MTSAGKPAPILTTDERVLELLVSRGTMTIDQLAGELGLGYISVRGSVERLRTRGAARVNTIRPGVADAWEVTPTG